MTLSATRVHLRKSTGCSLEPASILRIRCFCSACSSQTIALPDAGPRSGRPRSGARKSKFLAVTVLLSPVLANVGCQHIGPPTIAEDRVAYNEAIASSWKQQMLLNIVRLRYRDMAEFVDITSASQNYTLTGTTQASFGASIYPWDKMMNTLMPSLMGTRTKSDNPTVLYTPQSGSDFTKNLIAPIKPPELFNLIEERYHNVMKLTVISINDIRNDPTNTKFKNVAIAISEAYCKGDIRFPIEIDPDSKEKKVFMVIEEQDSKRSNPSEPCSKDPRYLPRYRVPVYPVAFIREALRLKAAVTKFEIVVGGRPTKETEIAVRTHSPISAMIWLSHYVPEMIGNAPTDTDPPLTVFSGPTKPPGDKYVAIKYRGNWFWIDWSDYRSSQAMIYLRTLLALADTGARPTAPVLTIPASR
jgi:hypothetical protein